MTLLDRWESSKRDVEAAQAEGRIDPDTAAMLLRHLEYRISRRPLILKRRRDRKAYRERQRAARITTCTDQK